MPAQNATRPHPDTFIRIDDRLIHGQVAVGWRQHFRFEHIIIIDDMLAADPFLADVLRLSAPAGVTVQVCTVENAAAALSARDLGRVLVLLKTPQTALQLHRAGLPFATLNVGNVAAGPGRRRVFKSISLAPDEIAALDELARQGVRIAFQQTPEEPAVDWQIIVQRHVKRQT